MEPASPSPEPLRDATRLDWRARILRVLAFVQEHLDEDLGIDRLAAVAGASPWHFHRMFRGLVGEPLAAHVRRLRLERAACGLRSSCDSILELALEAASVGVGGGPGAPGEQEQDGPHPHQARTRSTAMQLSRTQSSARKDLALVRARPEPRTSSQRWIHRRVLSG